jgi:shikimate kinase
MSRSICLSGMMGAGKTTVAEVLGRRLGRSVVDTDQEIERWTGRSVPELFAEQGELAFRDLERTVIVEIARMPDLVVALGGGTVLRDDTVADLLLSGVIVHLDVPVAELARRLAPGREARPLLRPGPDAAPLHEVVEELLAARRSRYAAVSDLIVDASGAPEEVAERIIAWAMEAGDVLTPSEHEQVMT